MSPGHRSSIDKEWTVTLPPDAVASLLNQPGYSGSNEVYIQMVDGGRLCVYPADKFEEVSGTMEMQSDISPDMKGQSRRLHALAYRTELAADGSVNIPERMRWPGGEAEIVAGDGYVEIRKPGGTYQAIDEQGGKQQMLSLPQRSIIKPTPGDIISVERSKMK